MERVERHEIVDQQTYEDERPAFGAAVPAVKTPRRVHVGEHLTFLFESTTTIRYQAQEMMWAERLVRERDIAHELDTYNALLGGDGELGCTLLVEIDDPAVRSVRLTEWYDLPEHLYARLEDGTIVRPTFDASQRGDGRLSSVQYLKFAVAWRVPVALGVDLAGMETETKLTAEQRAALADDLEERDAGTLSVAAAGP